MIQLDELKQYVNLHVKSQSFQSINPYEVLHSINTEPNPINYLSGSWDYQWSCAAEKCLETGYINDAIQCYNFARFPFPISDIQKKASEHLTSTFKENYCGQFISKHTIPFDGKSLSFYSSNLNKRKPCLIVVGGIVSIKEQWEIFLKLGKKLGFSVIVTEFPGVGENYSTYNAESHEMFIQILNHLKDQVDSDNCYIIGMSFGGNLAIKASMEDSRIKGITTVGAPVNKFYSGFSSEIPLITRETLSYVCDLSNKHTAKFMKHLAIPGDDIKKIKIPITYIFSKKDEIIPQSEKNFILDNFSNLKFIEFNDIHGSPNHIGSIRKVIPLSVLEQSKSKNFIAIWLLKTILKIQKNKKVS